MRRNHLASIAMLLALVVFGTAAWAQIPTREFAPAQEGPTQSADASSIYREGRVLVKFDPQAAAEVGIYAESPRRGLGPLETGLTGLDRAIAPFQLRELSPMLVRQPANRALAASSGIDRWYALDFDSSSDMESLARLIAREPGIEEATPDYRAFPAAIPNDPLHVDHWGHNNTAQLPDVDWGGTYGHTLSTTVGTVGFDANAQDAWDLGYGNASVIIAIIDSGVDINHPDLRLVTGYDYGSNDSNPMDDSADPGHGTACAGVAGSINNNGIGAAGIAGGASIMPLKVADNQGSMYFSAIVNAIYHAADNGADIISMSLGAAISSDSATDTALQYAWNAGLTILAATGNENASTISYPAINQYVMGVGAASPCGERKRSSSSSADVNPGVNTDPNGYTCDGERWWGSNYGVNSQGAAGAVDIIAPTILPTTDITGSGGYSTGDYSGFFNGTSAATPYAAGVAALIKSQNPSWTPTQIRDQLRNSAQDIQGVESGAGWDRYSGYGMVDAAAAVGSGGTPTAPVAAFSGTPTGGFFPLAVQFTDASSGNPTSWSWNFGDGTTSNAQNPGHTYTAAGTYDVTLTASNAQGSDVATKTAYITVTDPADTFASLPYSTGFETGSLDQYWTVSEGVEGRIQVTTANGPHSGSYHLTMDDRVNGSSYSLNEAWMQLNLSGETQVDLDFWYKEFGDENHAQDGVFFSDDGGASFVKVYDITGQSTSNNSWINVALDVDALAASNGLSLNSTFVVKFQQYDNYGISSDGFAFDDIAVTAGAAGTAPTAAFTADQTSGTAPLTVSFADQSTGAPTSWLWEFGDGNTSTAQNPGHTYTTAGTYNVALTATNSFGADTLVKTGFISVTTGGGGGTWQTITYDDFEGGMGNYKDGGGDMKLYTGGTHAYQGSNAADIQDNSGVSSSFYHTSGYDVSGYVDLEVNFFFKAVSMDNSREDFWVQYYDGGTWRTVEAFAKGIDFDNGVFYEATVKIPAGTYNYPANAKLRFMCDASGNRDDVYIDQITFRGLTPGSNTADFADGRTAIPQRFSLGQNRPNPFNPITQIEFALPQAERVRVTVFDVRGRRVATLADRSFQPGVHQLRWDASQMASGMYFYQIQAGSFVKTRKMMLVK